jgi:hypothetical protein
LLRLLHGNDGRIIIVINYQTRFRGVPFPRALYLTNLRSSRSPKPTFFSDPIAWPSFVPLPSFRTEHASHNSAKTKQSSLFLNLLGLRDGRNARRRFDRRFLRHAASRRHRFGFRRALPRGDRFLGRGRLLRARRLGLPPGPLLGVALVEARVGVGAAGAATTTAAVVFVGVFDFTGVFVADGVFAGDFAPPALPRNLSLKSLFDRFPSFSLNSLSARILAQAPGRCEARRGKLMSVFANARVSQVSKLFEIFQDTIQDWRRGHGRYGPRQAVRTGAVLRDARGERGGLHLGPRG